MLAHQWRYRHGVVGIDLVTRDGIVAFLLALIAALLLAALFIAQQQYLLLRVALALEVNGTFAGRRLRRHHRLDVGVGLTGSCCEVTGAALSGMIGGSMDVLLCPLYRQAQLYLDVMDNIYSASSPGSSSTGGLASLQGRLYTCCQTASI